MDLVGRDRVCGLLEVRRGRPGRDGGVVPLARCYTAADRTPEAIVVPGKS